MVILEIETSVYVNIHSARKLVVGRNAVKHTIIPIYTQLAAFFPVLLHGSLAQRGFMSRSCHEGRLNGSFAVSCS